jgi:hypothetical protein
MHTIQSQFSITDITANATLGTSVRRDTSTDEFIMASLVVNVGSDFDIDYGGIAVPIRVTLKFLSGDPLLISFDSGATFPLSMLLPGDFAVFPFNPGAGTLITVASAGVSNIIATVEPQ